MDYPVAVCDGFCELVTHGDAEPLVFRACLEDIFKHERWRPGMSHLFDHSDLNSGPLTVNDVRLVADFDIGFREKFGQSKVAVLLRRDL